MITAMTTHPTNARRRIFGRSIAIFALAAMTVAATGCDSGPRRVQAPEIRSAEAQRLSRQAEDAMKKGDFEKAAALSREAILASPEIPGSWNNLGVALMEQQNYVDAAQALRRAADLSPTDPTPYENLGLLYYRAGYDEDALRAYGLALERNEYWLPALRGAVVSAQRLNLADEATKERIRRGLMKESDPRWREIFERQRLRVDAALAERAKIDPARGR